MIAEQLINLVVEIAKIVYRIVHITTPAVEIGEQLVYYTSQILSISTQGANFVRFMVGDYAITLITISLGLIAYKYTLFPIIQFIRSIFVNSN